MVLCLSLVDRTACQHREVLEATKSNTAAAQKKQKEHYGRKHKGPVHTRLELKWTVHTEDC